jgi:signal transduction histidine kinase
VRWPRRVYKPFSPGAYVVARNLHRPSILSVEPEAGAAETEEFMSVAAHDLRNPIAVVRASAQMAQRQVNRGDTDGVHARLRSIVDQTDRLTDMLESFLEAARLSAGNLPLKPEHVDLRSIVEQAAERTRLLLGEHVDRSFEVEIPDGCVGAWDRMRIARAVRALLTNAMIYGSADSPVHVLATRHGNHVRLRVAGGGGGPDSDEAEHLFERFFRGRSAAEAGQSGSGLGLFTARGIARLHSGDVRHVEGDVFELELPLVAAK